MRRATVSKRVQACNLNTAFHYNEVFCAYDKHFSALTSAVLNPACAFPPHSAIDTTSTKIL